MDTLGLETLDTVSIISDVISLMLGISLSAACGFRVFVPFLIVSAFGVLSGFDLPSGFEWLDTNQALILFAVASGVEVFAYYIPWLDNLLDLVAAPLAAAAGAFVTAAAVPPDMGPLVQWTLAVIAGGGSAGLIKGLTSFFRIGSTAATGGIANPIFSTLELVFAALLSVLALTLPVIAGLVVVALLIFAIFKLSRFFAQKKTVSS